MHVAPDAKSEEIKKAFRKLAHAYHPDKNPENSFASAYFREIREAYRVLSDARSRREYDLARAREGGNRRSQPAVTPDFLLHEARKLSRQVAGLRPYRMDTGFLFASLQYLLSEAHLAILLQQEHRQRRGDFFLEIQPLATLLPYPFLKEIREALMHLAKGDERRETALLRLFTLKEKTYRQSRLFPWLVVLITLILCLAMFWYGRE